MTEYLVYIETKGDPVTPKGPVAHVPALPGASARGQTIAEAKEKIKSAIEAYLALLHDVGEPVPQVGENIHLEFEEVETTTFLTDYDALRPNEMETLFRWLAISRQELMDLVKGLPEEVFDWRLDDATISIREILCRLAEADLWYTDRLKRWPEAPLFRLAAARGVALERLRALTEANRAGITVYEGEEWTPRKIMRRMLEHERESVQQIRALLAARESG
jgi:predicted RNase H-like HicB family nuclease